MQKGSAADYDEFWTVALQRDVTTRAFEDDVDSAEDHATGSLANCVELRCEKVPPFTLKLCSLPLMDGVFSPLGAQAWYGSALLAALLLTSILPTTFEIDPGRRIQLHLEAFSDISALELGSGAVGLSGLALGWMLIHRPRQPTRLYQRDCVVLTDNDTDVLQQLQDNVRLNVDNMNNSVLDVAIPEYHVKYLDWSDGYSSSPPLQLVVGSELVYTAETALACAHIVTCILERNSSALVAIVQVADRDGWSTVFLPTLRTHGGLCVDEVPLRDATVHEDASRMIQQGGTMDRLDFVVCYVSIQR
jgi:hypothetical protein